MNPGDRRTFALEALLLLALAAGVRLIGISQDPLGHELYHVLAALGFLQDGSFTVGNGGIYDRTPGFTLLVASLFRLFGESLELARIPALVAGSLIPVVVFAWLRAAGARTAAWIAALLCALHPWAISLSVQVRFYTIQGVLFLGSCIALFYASRRNTAAKRRLLLLVGGALLFFGATRMQIISIAGVPGLILFLTLDHWEGLVDTLRSLIDEHPLAMGTVAMALIVGAAVLAGPMVDWLVTRGSTADLWAQQDVGNYRFYHWRLELAYPTIWTLFPFVVLGALAVRPRIALLATCVFATSLTFHSVVAQKAVRYVEYVMPFFFVLTGLAASKVPALVGSAARRWARSPDTSWWPFSTKNTAGLVVAVGVAFAAVGNDGVMRTVRYLGAEHRYRTPTMSEGHMSWNLAADTLRSLADDREVVVSSSDTKALYYLGTLDYVAKRNTLWVTGEGLAPEFSEDPRTGIPRISAPESFGRLIRCHPSGLVIIQDNMMGVPAFVTADAQQFIEENMDRIELPERYGLQVFEWDNAASSQNIDECASVGAE